MGFVGFSEQGNTFIFFILKRSNLLPFLMNIIFFLIKSKYKGDNSVRKEKEILH